MSSIWDEIFKGIENIKGKCNDVFTKLEALKDADGQPLNTSEEVPGYHESINSIRSRLNSAIGLFESLHPFERSSALIPMFYLKDFSGTFYRINEALDGAIEAFSKFDVKDGITTISASDLLAKSSDQSVSFNFARTFRRIDDEVDRALDNFYRIHPLLERPDYSQLESITDCFKNVFDEAANQKINLSKLLEESKEIKKQITHIAAGVGKKQTNITEIDERLVKLEKNANDSFQKISSTQESVAKLLSPIQETYTKADTLKKEVESYQKQFSDFQGQLDIRVEKYNAGNKELENLLKSLSEREGEVEYINKEALEALNFATVAGLAKGFEDRRVALDKELKNAYRWFVGSVIALLILSLIPVTYVVGTVFQFWGLKGLEYEYIVVLLLLLVPPTIMTRFTSVRFNRLFRLREQYAHKYSIAFSMPGFKEALQEDNQGQLVATTFSQLASNNPADCIDNRTTSEDHPSPIWNKFLDFFGKK